MDFITAVILSILSITIAIDPVSTQHPSSGPENGCNISSYNLIRCQGNFNLSSLLHSRPPQASNYELQIGNTSLEELSLAVLHTHNYPIDTILIQNAPNLSFIAAEAFNQLEESLSGFRAIGTKLSHSQSQERFANFSKLQEVYVGEESRCPDPALLAPVCSCRQGNLGRTTFNGASGTVWSYNGFGLTTEISCDTDKHTIDGDGIGDIFTSISRSNHTPKYFDFLKITGSNLTHFPQNVFGNLTFTRVHLVHVPNLQRIHKNAFLSSKEGIQMLEITDANFTAGNSNSTKDLFRAIKSLQNLRILRLFGCGLAGIPSHLVEDPNQSRQLRVIAIILDRKRHSTGLRRVGSWTFSWAPNLEILSLAKNYVEHFEPFVFGFRNDSKTPLSIDISGNPVNEKSFAKSALSSAKRPLQIKWHVDAFAGSDPANEPTLNSLPAEVFSPFLDENEQNYYEIEYGNIDIDCDCGSSWLFEEDGLLRKRVQDGIRIKRVEENIVDGDWSSIQCRAGSSFECLPNCVTFPHNGLLHCGRGQRIGWNESWSSNISKLIVSSKDVQYMKENATEGLTLKEISFIGCANLEQVHPLALSSSQASLQHFTVVNTSVQNLPNFAKFPALESIVFDGNYTLHSGMFDFSKETDIGDPKSQEKALIIQLGNGGNIATDTFTKLSNRRAIIRIRETKEYTTLGEMARCSPTKLDWNEATFAPIFANSAISVESFCYLECSCGLRWLYEDWARIRTRLSLWVIDEYFGLGKDFYCLPPNADISGGDNFLGVDVTRFSRNETYFKENC